MILLPKFTSKHLYAYAIAGDHQQVSSWYVQSLDFFTNQTGYPAICWWRNREKRVQKLNCWLFPRKQLWMSAVLLMLLLRCCRIYIYPIVIWNPSFRGASNSKIYPSSKMPTKVAHCPNSVVNTSTPVAHIGKSSHIPIQPMDKYNLETVLLFFLLHLQSLFECQYQLISQIFSI